MINYIGLDAHSTTSTFVTLDEKGLEVSKEKVFTTEWNLVKYIRSLKGKRYLTFEESNLSQWLYVVIKKEVDELIVCNPVYLNKKQGAKNDYRDGLHLANELRCNHLIPVYHDENNKFIELRSLISGYNDLVTEITRTKNRYKAIYRSQALPTKGTKIYSDPDRIKELESPCDQLVTTGLYHHIQSLEEIKKNYEYEFEQNMKKIKLLKKLDSIPGISNVRAHILAAIICDGKRFKNKYHLWSYSMLVRHHDESDNVTYRKRKVYGRTELKNVFMGAAESILLHGNSGLKKYYDQLRSKGLGHKEAKKSVARKIAAITLMIMNTGKTYDDKFEEKKIRKNKNLN